MKMMDELHPSILPIGTQVVSLSAVPGSAREVRYPAGAVGVVIAAPDEQSYCVRFPDGGEAICQHREIAVRAHLQRAGLQPDGAATAEVDLYDFVIYRCVVGSRAYGLDEDGSDVDRRGIYVPPATSHWSLYSPDSDYDLRGVHVLPLDDVVGLIPGRETVESSGLEGGLEIDLVTHDIGKFFGLLLKRNGYVLEQLYSPLVVHAMPEHQELKDIARGCITRHHSHHYLGFAHTQWGLFAKEQPHRIKPLLYVYRVLLTGIHLMRTGEVEANLVRLNHEYRLLYIDDLIARKVAGTEHATLEDADVARHEREYERLQRDLEAAYQASYLPAAPSAKPALHDLLVRLRLRQHE